MTALCFVPHLFRSDVEVAVQAADEHPAGVVELRGRFHWAALLDDQGQPQWVGTKGTAEAARRAVVAAWAKKFPRQ